ncbi:MAG: CDP-alcohol phosphatidyltransferase family protein [Tidjanibacter sp.]|nr:CDP-alcohol phosphatidyltransferase family protein [Tidjanibacter sp.]
MGTEKAARIQTSLLNGVEKKALVWLAKRQPRWVTSDLLTYIGVAGAFICGLGFALSSLDIGWLWLSSAGLVINWYGDSLDGTLARVRNTQRPKYGFFIDHSIDAITITMMCVGAGLSPLLRLDLALAVLVAYLIISIYTYVCTIVTNQMRLTYGKLGPTEFRLIVIICNTLFIYTPWRNLGYIVAGIELGLFDIIAIVAVAIMAVLWLQQWLRDRKTLSKLDPLKKSSEAAGPKPQTQRIKKRETA